jgi:hypothetical protein
MLDIPELGDMICQLLSPHDLAQCAQVSKRWDSIVTPHLWRDLSWRSDAWFPSYEQKSIKLRVHRDLHSVAHTWGQHAGSALIYSVL